MKIKTQDYNDVVIIELRGELNGDFVDALSNTTAECINRKKSGIVLDMSNVGFIDSQGLEQLLQLWKQCYENDCQLKLAGLDENCSKILEITRLEPEFDRYKELTEAVKSFA